MHAPAPPQGTLQRWALDYVEATTWEEKLSPPPPPDAVEEGAPPRRVARPGRGPAFLLSEHGHRSTGSSKLRSPLARARLIHTFLHHELQAAELIAWALLAFPEAPPLLRRGLLGVFRDEVRHMAMYAELLAERGHAIGSFPVRDWFWERIPTVPDLRSFLATLGIGFEGANLDHAARFAARFRAAGDERAAAVEEQVGREEVPHVRLAARWFVELGGTPLAGQALFDAWRAALPEPLSPLVMRGEPLAREARQRAGLDEAFLAALGGWVACSPSS